MAGTWKENTFYQISDSETVRDRKTGRRRNLYENAEKEREKQKKEEERKQTYTRWGAGLKQIEEFKERVATESHEMSKPVARYADDKDLEEHLRNQYRTGDPMAEYFRKKAKETQTGPCKRSLHFAIHSFIVYLISFSTFQQFHSIKDHFQKTVSTFGLVIVGMVLTVRMDTKRNGSMCKIKRKRSKKKLTNTALKICKFHSANVRQIKYKTSL